jgi:hypothetical protein
MLLVTIIAISCQQEESLSTEAAPNGVTVRDGRLVFASVQDYADRLTEIEKLSPEDQLAWTRKFKFSPLENRLAKLKSRDKFIAENKMQHLGPAHFFVLNEDRLVQVADDVIYYDEQTKYLMKAKDFDELDDKSDIRKSPTTLEFVGQSIGSQLEHDDAGRVEDTYFDAYNKGEGGIGAGGHQHEFNVNGVRKKFVDEWFVYTENLGGSGCGGDTQIRSTLRVRMKLEEYRKFNQLWFWFPSEDPRTINWNFMVWNVYFEYGAHPTSVGCAYRGLEMGPWSASSSRGNLQSWSAQSTNIMSTPIFWGEWHATYDLKKWSGRCQGVINQVYDLTTFPCAYNF